MHYTRKLPDPRDWLSFPVLPAHRFESTAIPTDHAARDHAFGTLGMVADRSADGVVFRAVAEGAERPLYRNFELIPPPDDPAEAVRAIEAGTLQGIVDVPASLWPKLSGDDSEIVLRTYPAGELWFVALSPERPELSDPRVREALDLLIDRNALIRTLDPTDKIRSWPPFEPVSGPFLLSSGSYDRSVPLPDADPARAAALLADAGWGPAAPLTLTVAASDTTASSVVDGAPALVEAIAAQLAARGIAAEVAAGPDADLVVSAVVVPPSWDPGELLASLHADDLELDRLATAARRTTTDTESQDAWRAVHRYVAKTRPALFLWSANTLSAWTPEVWGPISPWSYWGAFGQWRRTTP